MEVSETVRALGKDAALMLASLAPAENQNIRKSADLMLDAAAAATIHVDNLVFAAEDLRDVLPVQEGGKGLLSDQLAGNTGRFFREFAEVARDVWLSAGLTIGGNGVPDQGYGAFLDAVHGEVFGRTIPSRTKLMSALRNTWPGPRIR